MGSENHPLRNIDIYHNLPTFDPTITNLTAIITGANGISGFHTMRALLSSPQRWKKIYALSRRPPPEPMMNLLTVAQRSLIQHVAVDFLSSPEEIAEAITSASVENVTHVFFYSYAQPAPPPGQPLWSNADELVTVNTTLLKNFLAALPLASINPAHITLQTGAKNYGVHLGRTHQPSLESDPQPSHLSPNFYYPQEAALFSYTKSHPSTKYSIIMPSWIIGGVTNAAMNALHPYAIYAAVCAAKSEPLVFPGDWVAWQQVCHHATARLTGYLAEWAALEGKCADQRFNATDTSPFTAERFFAALSRWFGVQEGWEMPPTPSSSSSSASAAASGGGDEKKKKEEEELYPISFIGPGGKDAPLGYGPGREMKARFSLVAWAKEDSNKEVWKRLMAESKGALTHDPFEDPEGNFSCGDAAWSPHLLGMDKARKMGWTGYVDTLESVFEMYSDMAELGMLPKMRVDSAREDGAVV